MVEYFFYREKSDNFFYKEYHCKFSVRRSLGIKKNCVFLLYFSVNNPWPQEDFSWWWCEEGWFDFHPTVTQI